MARESYRSLDGVPWRAIQLIGGLALLFVILFLFGSNRQLIGALCLLLLAQFGLSLLLLSRGRENNCLPANLHSLFALAQDPEVRMAHESIAEALANLVSHSDPIFRKAALERLQAMAEESRLMGTATIEFASTESWRVVYDELLRSPGLHLYRSVSLVQTPNYWQDSPGQQSTKLNLELHDAGVVSVERIAIISDHLWPEESLFPVGPVHAWLEEQHLHGIWLQLVRESELSEEAELIADFGIYGNRAVGWHHTDPAGRTQRFVLSFDFERLRKAEEHCLRADAMSGR